MWVLPDSLPALRRPTIACMGFVEDLQPPSLRHGESEPAGPGEDFVPDFGLGAVPG